MSLLLGTVFLSSLAGSLHCAGMCGGLAAVAAGGAPAGRLAGLAAYNGGRLLAYASLGAAAGGLGGAVDLAGALVGVQRGAALVAGTGIALWGLVSLARALGLPVPAGRRAGLGAALLVGPLGRAGAGSPMRRALVLGALTGLLPCGWLWAFVATAAGTAAWGDGALVMAVFWLGTLPLMAGLGAGLHAALGPLRRHAPALSAAALVAVGLLAVAGRGAPVPPAPPAHVGGPAHGHR